MENNINELNEELVNSKFDELDLMINEYNFSNTIDKQII